MKNTFSKQEVHTLAVIISVLFFGSIANLSFGYFEWARCSATERETLCAVDFPVELNSSEKCVLEAIPGVGPALASRIIEYREKNGGFKTRCEIRKVSGVGPRMYEKIRDKIHVACDETPDADDPETASALSDPQRPKIDINLASVENFAAVKGVGGKLGKKIIEFREKQGGRITGLGELSKVGGIGAKRMKTIAANFIIY